MSLAPWREQDYACTKTVKTHLQNFLTNFFKNITM